MAPIIPATPRLTTSALPKASEFDPVLVGELVLVVAEPEVELIERGVEMVDVPDVTGSTLNTADVVVGIGSILNTAEAVPLGTLLPVALGIAIEVIGLCEKGQHWITRYRSTLTPMAMHACPSASAAVWISTVTAWVKNSGAAV